jgi:hypothetical protein
MGSLLKLPAGFGLELQELAGLQPTLLTIHLANVTAYYQDTVDLMSLATLADVMGINAKALLAAGHNFFPLEVIADIVQINDDNVKGLYLSKNLVTVSSPTLTKGTLISDASITGFRHDIFKILNPDDPAIAIGSIMAAGVSGQPVAPGGPPEIHGGDWAIIGGTGAYLGVSGQMGGQGGMGGGDASIRATSVREDPSQRRILAGPSNITTMYLYVIPMMRPRIISVFHVDAGNFLTPVTSADPVKGGDQLTLFASGLGPVTDVAVGEPFPANPPTVISPVTVTIGDTMIPIAPGDALGFPGSTNGYSVRFIVPAVIHFPPLPNPLLGYTSIKVTSAWIPSAAVRIQAID